jgi:hypothetical protein
MDWRSVVANVVPTPAEHRQWVPAGKAQAVLRCSTADIEDLSRSGLATRNGSFDRFDVWNVGLYSGTGNSRPELEMELSRRLLDLPGRDWVSPTDYRVLVEADCPRGGACGDRQWSAPSIIGVTWSEHAVVDGRAHWVGRLRRTGARGIVRAPTVERSWNGIIQNYRFHLTPMALATSTNDTRRRRVGGCTALSLLLTEELTRQGLRARLRQGYLVAGFVARVHSWAEVHDTDGEWKPLDVSMAVLARRFFTSEYARFCRGSTLNRLVPIEVDGDLSVAHRCRDRTGEVRPRVTFRHM